MIDDTEKPKEEPRRLQARRRTALQLDCSLATVVRLERDKRLTRYRLTSAKGGKVFHDVNEVAALATYGMRDK